MQPNLHTVLANVDHLVARAQIQVRRRLGHAEGVRLVPYRGWATPRGAIVLGRALLADVTLEERLGRSPRLVRVAYERFGTVEPAPVSVHVTWQGRSTRATSDAGGFIDACFPIAGEVPIGLTRAELTLEGDGKASAALAEVYGLHPRAAFGVISDIDDTVLETELTNPWKRVLQLLYSEQRMRLPFEGIAALYHALSHQENPIFYVSNAPWNLYQHVVELLDHHDIPKGPLLLRDSRLAERTVVDADSGQVLVHKQRALRRLVEAHPDLPFVMLGDSSRRDPLRYVEVAEAYPGRVAAIYIRRVRGILARRGGLQHVEQRARRAGVELFVADDTVAIAEHARSRGFVPPAEVGRVVEGKRQDEAAPPAELTALGAGPDEH